MSSHIKSVRLNRLPAAIRRELVAARHKRGWSQAELGRRAGLPQMHVSSIETGKMAPPFDPLLGRVRVLGGDLLMVPRSLVPAVQALIRDDRRRTGRAATAEPARPLYAADDDQREAGGD